MLLYHGSIQAIEIGEFLKKPESAYVDYDECVSIENAFEHLMPLDKTSRKNVYIWFE
jgi:hypothetical protein